MSGRSSDQPLRIFLMLSHDIVFKPDLLYRILLRNPGEVVGVAEVLPKPRSQAAQARDKAKPKSERRAGSLEFWGPTAAAWLGGMVVLKKLSSALPTPGFVRTRSTVKRVAKSFGVPWELVTDVNDPAWIAKLEARQPDVVVSFQHQIFKEPILRVPRLACINCHPAALPKYRGVKPIFWAMLDGASEIGVTVHTMEPTIDTGRIVEQRVLPLREGSSLLENYYRAYAVAGDVIADALDRLSELRGVEGLPQIPQTSEYYRYPTNADVGRFRARGLRLL